jgi:hypothetical protein
VAIVLGRDCTLDIGGSVAGVREVTYTGTAEEIQYQPYGSRDVFRYTTGYSQEVTVESIDDSFLSDAKDYLASGEDVSVSGTGFTFNAVVVSVNARQPLDDVCSFTVVFKVTNEGLR